MFYKHLATALLCFQVMSSVHYIGVCGKRGAGGTRPWKQGKKILPLPPPGFGLGKYGFSNGKGGNKLFPPNNKHRQWLNEHLRPPKKTRTRNPYLPGFTSQHIFHNPYFHIITSEEEYEWSRDSGWNSATEDEYHTTTDQRTPGITEPVVTTTPEPEVEKAWRGQGSFTGDISLACLSKKNVKVCASGVVKVFHKERNEWGTICGDTWSAGAAKVVCNYLNFKRGKPLKVKRRKVPSETRYNARYFKKLRCGGDEWALTDCSGDPIKKNYTCRTPKLAGVKCSGYIKEKDRKESGECGMSNMKCNAGDRCIDPSYVCDGMSDCPWGSDEANCNEGSCKKDQYWCGPSGGGCISNEYLCDGEPDCIDESDEKDCEEFLSTFTKTSAVKARSNKYEVEWERLNAYLCAQKCKQETNFVCTSFDIHTNTGLCLLYSASTPQEVKKSKRWEHYETDERENCDVGNKYRCRDGMCLKQTKVCDTVEDCFDGKDEKECEPLKVRLQGGSGSFEGHVQVSKGMRYGLVCDAHWTIKEANVVCRQLGYSRGASKALKGGSFGGSDREYKMKNVKCNGNESSLDECSYDGWSKVKCMSDHEAGVVCQTEEVTTPFILTTPRTTLGTTAETTPKPTSRICGMKPPESDEIRPTARVVGGTSVTPHEWPWQVAIWLPWMYWCGGALIDPCWVLTAAHCFQRLYPHNHYTIRLGDHLTGSDDGTEQDFQIAELIKHDYDTETRERDIALIRIESKSGQCAQLNDAVRLICLPKSSNQFAEKKMCHVTGWGKTSSKSSSKYTPVLQEAQVPLISFKKCKRDSEYEELLKNDMLCAGYLSGGIDSCQGDSGGPLSCQDSKDGLYYLWGVVSWGNGCARPKAPGIYSEVTDYIEWIEEKTGIVF